VFKRIAQWIKTFDSCEADIKSSLKSTDQNAISWHHTYDVVVVGYGGAGVSAALEAKEQGASVVALERYSGGGSTNISGGICYMGAGTAIQQQCGVEDDADNMFNYLKHEAHDVVSEETLRDFCNQSVDNFNWLTANGVKFDPSLFPYKTSYPPDSHYLYYSGNESFPPYNTDAKPAPRGHRPHKKGISGQALFQPLRDSCRQKQVDVVTQACTQQLITDDKGNVVGIQANVIPEGSKAAKLHHWLYQIAVYLRYASMYVPLIQGLLRKCMNGLESKYGQSVNYRANKGVILSTGGFYFSRSMLKQYAPKFLQGMPLGTIGDDGSGIQLGQSVGAKTALMDKVSAWRFVNPPETFIRGVLVGNKGKRICNEMLYGAQIGERMNTAHDGKGYLIIDKTLWRDTIKVIGLNRAMWFQAAYALVYMFVERKKGKSIVELAVKLDISPEVLLETVKEYNALAKGEENDPMGKPKEFIHALETGPYYALNCSYDAKFIPCPSISVGGLVVDEKTGEVKNENDKVIKGLYAAGRSAVGIPSHSYVSGLSIADCIYSGRRAGKHAARIGN
jgi:3-oxo-5alpha-steroid 4-dehydrogenase